MARGEGRIGANVMNLAVGEQAKAQLLFRSMNRMSRMRGKRAWGAGKGRRSRRGGGEGKLGRSKGGRGCRSSTQRPPRSRGKAKHSGLHCVLVWAIPIQTN
jgi:hypothetical protein